MPKFVTHYGLFNLQPDFVSDYSSSSNNFTAGNNFYLDIVRNNVSILDTDKNWTLLLFKGVYYIKKRLPSINTGLKASRNLCVFK